MEEWRERVVEAALSWLRTPYHHAACVKGAGVDCAMLLTAVYHEAGIIPHIDPRPYPPDWHLHRGEEKFLGWVTQFAHKTDTPGPGDVILFKYGRCVSHGGIVYRWPTIIHSYMPARVVTLDDIAPNTDLAKRVHSYWTFG
jgi:cell wall-associated NlpC family hydrolase